MCGIVGFIGRKPAAPLLLEGLAKLSPSALAAGRYKKFRRMGANALRKERT